MPWDYDSFAMPILSWNYREIDFEESILVSIKVVIALLRGFPNNDIMEIPLM